MNGKQSLTAYLAETVTASFGPNSTTSLIAAASYGAIEVRPKLLLVSTLSREVILKSTRCMWTGWLAPPLTNLHFSVVPRGTLRRIPAVGIRILRRLVIANLEV